MRTFKYLLAAASIAATVSGASFAVAQDSVEDFYSGNTVTLIVSANAGDASDVFARQFAPFLAKHIPGQPDIFVENLPGASGMNAAVQLMNNEARDGSVVALLQRNNFYIPLLQNNNNFDPRQVNWLGSLAKESYTLVAWNDAPVQTAEDVFTTPLRIGATAFSNENRTLPALMNEFFGTQFEIIVGYESGPAATLALERGEVKGLMRTVNLLHTGAREAQWVADGSINVIMNVALEAHPEFADIPNILDYLPADRPEAESVARFLLSPLEAGRPFAAPPEVPEDRVAALRSAFDAAAADPEFLEVIRQANAEVDPITGQAVQDIVSGLYATPEDIVARVRDLVIEQ